MNNLRTWWHNKTTHKKQNWLMLALACCLIAGGFVEAYSWIALVGVLPAVGIAGLEVMG